jgi:hypothetical protein
MSSGGPLLMGKHYEHCLCFDNASREEDWR